MCWPTLLPLLFEERTGPLPHILVIWSAMIPRLVWRGASYHQGVERAKQKANKEIKRSLEGGLGLFLPPLELWADHPELYKKNGVHLSDSGLDIFLADL